MASYSAQRRTGSVLLALLLLTGLIVASGGSSEAAVRVVIAGPVAALNGYLTPVVFVPKGTAATFRNLDPLVRHDVRARRAGTCSGRLFCTPLISFGGNATVKGVQKLKPGTYDFFCSLHGFMTGRLIVR